jgi:8-hydroxy-5-deazaflavin:NADPH oxidoreductase
VTAAVGTISILGGTGPLGRGLALRWVAAGYDVVVGSRSADRADETAAELSERLGSGKTMRGAENADAVQRADILVVAVPYQGQRPLLESVGGDIGDRLVVNVVNPVAFDDLGPARAEVPGGSASEECQEMLPEASVVSAFKSIPARKLAEIGTSLDCDTFICGDDETALERTSELVESIDGLRPVVCRPLRLSREIEGLTPLLIAVNRRYKAHSALRVIGLPQRT